MTSPVRKAHAAGSFYPREPDALRDYLRHQLTPKDPAVNVRAVIVPHAGYLYSGQTAGEVFCRVKVPSTALILGPNHRGEGADFALYPEGSWETPLGPVGINRDFAAGLLKASDDLCSDPRAHEKEHSLEVEVPFLRYLNPKVEIVPLAIGTTDFDRVRRLAFSVLEFLKAQPDFLIVASTDMSHYESDEATRKKDRYALEAIEALDAEALVKAARQYFISMCGIVPVYLALLLAKGLGAQKAELINYRTSADANQDRERVVGYAGFIIP